VADVYVCGSERFDSASGDNSWAVGPDWRPLARCAKSAILAEIYGIAYGPRANVAEQEGCLGNDAEYPLCLGYGAFAVREIIGHLEPSLILGESHSLGLAVGFDDGDFVLLGKLSASGFTKQD
jgi:hypothetical protein